MLPWTSPPPIFFDSISPPRESSTRITLSHPIPLLSVVTTPSVQGLGYLLRWPRIRHQDPSTRRDSAHPKASYQNLWVSESEVLPLTYNFTPSTTSPSLTHLPNRCYPSTRNLHRRAISPTKTGIAHICRTHLQLPLFVSLSLSLSLPSLVLDRSPFRTGRISTPWSRSIIGIAPRLCPTYLRRSCCTNCRPTTISNLVPLTNSVSCTSPSQKTKRSRCPKLYLIISTLSHV